MTGMLNLDSMGPIYACLDDHVRGIVECDPTLKWDNRNSAQDRFILFGGRREEIIYTFNLPTKYSDRGLAAEVIVSLSPQKLLDVMDTIGGGIDANADARKAVSSYNTQLAQKGRFPFCAKMHENQLQLSYLIPVTTYGELEEIFDDFLSNKLEK